LAISPSGQRTSCPVAIERAPVQHLRRKPPHPKCLGGLVTGLYGWCGAIAPMGGSRQPAGICRHQTWEAPTLVSPNDGPATRGDPSAAATRACVLDELIGITLLCNRFRVFRGTCGGIRPNSVSETTHRQPLTAEVWLLFWHQPWFLRETPTRFRKRSIARLALTALANGAIRLRTTRSSLQAFHREGYASFAFGLARRARGARSRAVIS
jgi:hypothetical protein